MGIDKVGIDKVGRYPSHLQYVNVSEPHILARIPVNEPHTCGVNASEPYNL